MVTPLLQLHEELTLVSDDSEIIGNSRALSALAHAKEEVSQQRARLLAGYYDRHADQRAGAREVHRLPLAHAGVRGGLQRRGRAPDNGQLFVNAMQDEKVYRAELTKSRAIVLASDQQPHRSALISRPPTVRQWFYGQRHDHRPDQEGRDQGRR